ncbi:hypothetical protein ACH419_36515 [Streptomyces bobili]|uniref:hypothetical protein n=1 Tax=Streptomyces bobili TaxID=67280 RepID=UPI003797914B
MMRVNEMALSDALATLKDADLPSHLTGPIAAVLALLSPHFYAPASAGPLRRCWSGAWPRRRTPPAPLLHQGAGPLRVPAPRLHRGLPG